MIGSYPAKANNAPHETKVYNTNLSFIPRHEPQLIQVSNQIIHVFSIHLSAAQSNSKLTQLCNVFTNRRVFFILGLNKSNLINSLIPK